MALISLCLWAVVDEGTQGRSMMKAVKIDNYILYLVKTRGEVNTLAHILLEHV